MSKEDYTDYNNSHKSKSNEKHSFNCDTDLLEMAKTRWNIGDWDGLIAIDTNELESDPHKARIALFVASGYQQKGDIESTKKFTQKAINWGEKLSVVAQILIGGVHITLGRALLLEGDRYRSLEHFKASLKTDASNKEKTKMISKKVCNECQELKLSEEIRFFQISNTEEKNYSYNDNLYENSDFDIPDDSEMIYKSGSSFKNFVHNYLNFEHYLSTAITFADETMLSGGYDDTIRRWQDIVVLLGNRIHNSLYNYMDYDDRKQKNFLVSLDYSNLLSKLVEKRKINIVIVGANDGKLNDPIFPFIREHPETTKVLLIEPQEDLAPYIKENYSFHNDKEIATCGVGSKAYKVLYTVSKEYWEAVCPSYAKKNNWPLYRAPTGVASANRSHVEEWIKRYSPNVNSADAVKPISVRYSGLLQILLEKQWPVEIDVLQIDVEGHDDEVIYNSQIERTKPKIIYFESLHFNFNKKINLFMFLNKKNYYIYESRVDTIAIHETAKL